MRKTRIKYKKEWIYDCYEGEIYTIAKIQVKVLGLWWTINEIWDEDSEYVLNRAKEIMSYINTEE